MLLKDEVLYLPKILGIKRKAKEIRFIRDGAGCFICVSHSKDRCGYPKLNANKKNMTVSRYIFKMFNPDIEVNGLEVRHICDKPACINPDHLIIGTHLDNMRDMKSRGRSNHPDQKGERHSQSILSVEKVLDIRALWDSRKLSQREIAFKFGISQPHVSDIVTHKAWSHIS